MPAKNPPERHERRFVLVLSKFPRPGKSKTRVGLEPHLAAKLATVMLVDLVERLATSTTFDTVIVGARGDTEEEFRSLFSATTEKSNLEVLIPGGGTIAQDVRSAFDYAFDRAQKVILITADMPHVGLPLLDRVFQTLETVDLAICPSFDGGACPRGMRKPIEIFDLDSAAPNYFALIARRAKELGASVKVLDLLFDIDRPEDLNFFYNWQSLLSGDDASYAYCRHTMLFLADILND